MPRYVALLRGINVGKNKRIAMGDLKALHETLGYTDVKTHLNSGNVVFTADVAADDTLAHDIERAIASSLDMDVPVIVRSGEEMELIVESNPFPQHADDHKTLHVTFLLKRPDPAAIEALADHEKGDDDYRVIGTEVYLYYPNKLTGATFMPNGLDKALGMHTTSRNWRTVARLAELAQ